MQNVGTTENWFSRKLEDSVQLPGTTDENHKGIQQDEKPIDRLARPWFWKGPAWYQRGDNSRLMGWQAHHAVPRAHEKLPRVGG